MKTKVLMVDDESLVLEAMQRLLRGMRAEWDIDYAESGRQAIERLSQADYDIVISDMRMPGMNGVELLDHVRKHSPRTIRLVLSGHADLELALRCVGVAHQYLSKPCDPELLKQTVARLTRSQFAMRSEQVLKVVAGLKHLPSLPAAYLRLQKMIEDPDASMDDMGALIASDIAMNAKVLQIANSSFFGLARTVSKASEAASFLGLETLKALVLTTKVFSQFEKTLPSGFSVEKFAMHGQQVAAAAVLIAEAEQAPRSMVDEVRAAGMLHDVGKLVLASSLPEQFKRVLEQAGAHATEAEREAFGGATHAEVGGYLLGLWGLPPNVVEAIYLHHTPTESAAKSFSPLTAVHVADSLITGAPLDTAYLENLGLTARLPIWKREVDAMLQSAA